LSNHLRKDALHTAEAAAAAAHRACDTMRALAVGFSADPRCCRPEHVLDWLRDFATSPRPDPGDATVGPGAGLNGQSLVDTVLVVHRDGAGGLYGMAGYHGLHTVCHDALQRGAPAEAVVTRARAWLDVDPASGLARGAHNDAYIAYCVPSPCTPLTGPEPFAHPHACVVFIARRDRARTCFTALEITLLETACHLAGRVLARPVGADGATDHEHWQRLLAEATEGVVEASAALDALQVAPSPLYASAHGPFPWCPHHRASSPSAPASPPRRGKTSTTRNVPPRTVR